MQVPLIVHRISFSGNNVYVVWEDNTLGNNEVLIRISSDGDTTFGPTLNLSNNAGSSSSPQISPSGVVWEDNTLGNNEIFFRQNSGTTFGPTLNLSNNAGSSDNPQIFSFKVVWEDDTRFLNEILYKSGTSGPIYTLDRGHQQADSNPRISSSGNNVYVVWQGSPNFNSDIILAVSNDGGTSFGSPINLSNNLVSSDNPRISSSGNNVHVVWQEKGDILLRESNDGGTAFDDTINLSSNTGTSINPQIISSENNPYVVWQDSSFGNFEILFKNSNAAINLTINLSSNTGTSINPQISSSSSS